MDGSKYSTITIVGIKCYVHMVDFQKMLNTKQIEPETRGEGIDSAWYLENPQTGCAFIT